MLPYFNVMDGFSYLLTNNSSFSQIRDCQKSEGYSLMTDGFVKHVETVTFEQPGYFAVKARVKPRTRDMDPVSSARLYFLWIILSSVDLTTEAAFCLHFACAKEGLMDAMLCYGNTVGSHRLQGRQEKNKRYFRALLVNTPCNSGSKCC